MSSAAAQDCANFNLFFSTLGGIDLYLSPDNCCTWSQQKVQCDATNRITWISLENQQLDGSFSSAVGSLSNLKLLSLKNNKLVGKLPDVFSRLTNLNYLTIQNNAAMAGSIPDSLGNVPSLVTLDLTGTAIGGTLPSSLAQNSKPVTYTGGCPYDSQNLCLPSVNGVTAVVQQCKGSTWSSSCGQSVAPVVITSSKTTTTTTTTTTATAGIAVTVAPPPEVNTGNNGNNGGTSLIPSNPFDSITNTSGGNGKPLNEANALILVCAVTLFAFVLLGLGVYYGTKWRREKRLSQSELNAAFQSRKHGDDEGEGHIYLEGNVTTFTAPVPAVVGTSVMQPPKPYYSHRPFSVAPKQTYPQFPAGLYMEHHEPPPPGASTSASVPLDASQALEYSGDYVYDPSTNQYFAIKRVDSFQEDVAAAAFDPARDC